MTVNSARFFAGRRQHGFTLIEIMVVVVIVAILAAIAYPSYTGYIRKARRADAMDALMYLQHLQEKHRASHSQYGTLAEIGYPGASSPPVLSGEGHYALTVTDNTALGFTATASAIGVQTSDIGCATLSIVVNASNPRGDRQATGGEVCWRH